MTPWPVTWRNGWSQSRSSVSLMRASVGSTFRLVRSLMAFSRFGMLDGFAYQSPPPSYCRRAIVRFAAGAGPNEVRTNARSDAKGRIGIRLSPRFDRQHCGELRFPRQPRPRHPVPTFLPHAMLSLDLVTLPG